MKNRVLFDLNVVLDVVLKRPGHFQDSTRALDLAVNGQVQGLMAAHSVTTLFYILEKELGPSKAREILGKILTFLSISQVDESVIVQALKSGFKDFEDGVTYFSGLASRATSIVTRNLKGFAAGKALMAIHPGVFFVSRKTK